MRRAGSAPSPAICKTPGSKLCGSPDFWSAGSFGGFRFSYLDICEETYLTFGLRSVSLYLWVIKAFQSERVKNAHTKTHTQL